MRQEWESRWEQGKEQGWEYTPVKRQNGITKQVTKCLKQSIKVWTSFMFEQKTKQC